MRHIPIETLILKKKENEIVFSVISGTPEADELCKKLRGNMKNTLRLQKENVLTNKGQDIIKEMIRGK